VNFAVKVIGGGVAARGVDGGRCGMLLRGRLEGIEGMDGMEWMRLGEEIGLKEIGLKEICEGHDFDLSNLPLYLEPGCVEDRTLKKY
jgi:hypothetical protein